MGSLIASVMSSRTPIVEISNPGVPSLFCCAVHVFPPSVVCRIVDTSPIAHTLCGPVTDRSKSAFLVPLFCSVQLSPAFSVL